MSNIYRRKFPETLLRTLEKLFLDPVSTVCVRIKLWIWGATVGCNLSVSGRVRLRLLGNLHIGNRVRMNSGYANFVGAGEPMSIWVCPGGR